MSITNDYRYEHKPCASKTADKLSLPLRCALNGKTVRLVDGKKDLRKFNLGERILSVVLLILFPPLLIISGLALLSKKSCIKAKIPAVLLTKQQEEAPPETEENETTATPSIPSLKPSKLIKTAPKVKPPETPPKKTTHPEEAPAASTENAPQAPPTAEKPASAPATNTSNVKEVAQAVDAFILGTLQFSEEPAALPSKPPVKQENLPPPQTPTTLPTSAPLSTPSLPEEITTPPPPAKPAELPPATPEDNLDEGVPPPSLDIIGFLKEAADKIKDKKPTILELFLQYGRKLSSLSFKDALAVISQSLEKSEEILAYIKQFKEGKTPVAADLNHFKMANTKFITKLIENLNDSPETVIAIFELLHHPKAAQSIISPENLKQTLLKGINKEIIENKNFILFQHIMAEENENGIIKQAYIKNLLIETLEGMGNLNSDTVDVWCNCDLEVKSYFRALLLFSEIDSLINEAEFSLPKVTEELKKALPLLIQLSPELLERKKLKATDALAEKLRTKVEAKGGKTLEQTKFRDIFNEIKGKLGWSTDIKIKSNTLLDPISPDYYYFIGNDPQKVEAAREKFMDAADRLGQGENISDFRSYFVSLGGTGAKFDACVEEAAEKAPRKAAPPEEKKPEPAAPTAPGEPDAVEPEADEE